MKKASVSLIPSVHAAGALSLYRCQRLQGFTLVELLVVITIIAILSGLGFAGTTAALAHARKVREVGAAKNLISAYQNFPAENNGQLLPASDSRVGEVQLPNGDIVRPPSSTRYPYRLAPYFGGTLEGTILVNKNKEQIPQGDTYKISLYPALGMNSSFVGGDVAANGTVRLPADCLTHTGQTGTSPIVFASAASGETVKTKIDGYCYVTAPNTTGKNWSGGWTKDASPSSFGNIDARHSGKAVCAYLDGVVKVHTMEELKDMRLWSHRAAETDNQNYTASTTGGGGRR